MALRSTITFISIGVVGLGLGIFVLPALFQPSQEETAAPLPLHHKPVSKPRTIAIAAPSTQTQRYPSKTAPDFSLPDQNGALHSLSECKGKWVVLAFYPMDGSTSCTEQNKTYTKQKDLFAPLNAVVYTISIQDVNSKRSFAQQASLTHTLLADVDGKVAQAYGTFMGDFSNRVTFYIRPDRTIAAVDDNIHVMTAAEDSLTMLKALQSHTAIVAANKR